MLQRILAHLYRSPFWFWAWICLFWQAHRFFVLRHQVLEAAGLKNYHREDAILTGLCYFFLTLVCSLAATIGWEFLRRKNFRASWLGYGLTQFLIATIVWFNLRLYVATGLHLLDRTTLEKLFDPQVKGELALGKAAVADIASNLTLEAVICTAAGLLTWFLWQKRARVPNFFLRPLKVFSLVLPLVLATAWQIAYQKQIWSNVALLGAFPAYGNVDRKELLARQISYPPQLAPESLRPKTLATIGLESFQSANWSAERMPLTWKFVSEHRDLCFGRQRHFSSANTTEYGIFGLVYGLNSDLYRYFRKNKVPSYALEHLRRSGYRLEGYTSSALNAWAQSEFIYKNFDIYRENAGPKNHLNDLETTASLKKALLDRSTSKFIFGFLASTHHDYSYPKDFEFHTPTLPEAFSGLESQMSADQFRSGVLNRYLNSVRFVDAQLAEILKVLVPRLKRGEVEIAITGDHGEEMWENGSWGHASTRFVSQRIRVPLIWCGTLQEPNPKIPTSHADIMATHLDMAGARRGDFEKYLSGISLADTAMASRPLVVTVGTGYPEVSRLVSLIDQKMHTHWIQKDWRGHQLTRVTDERDNDLPLDAEIKTHWQKLLPLFESKLQQFSP